MENFDFETCMDIFDWFDDTAFEYLNHIILSKVDGEKRVRRALPELQKKARWLVTLHRDTESAYPVEFLDQPARRWPPAQAETLTAKRGVGRGSHSFQIKLLSSRA